MSPVPVVLSCNPQDFRELCQLDRNEKPLPRDQQTKVVMQVPIRCTSDEKDVAVSFYLRGEVPVAEANKIPNELSRDFSVVATIARSAFEILPNRSEWPWYGMDSIEVIVPFETVSDRTPPISQRVQISASLAEDLKRETNLRRIVQRTFEKTKDYLYDKMGCSLRGESMQIRNAAQFIEACRDREVWSYGDFMDDSRYDKLMPYIDHLLSLKNPAHPSVRASEDARTLLYLARCPEFWRCAPPRPSDYDLEWLGIAEER